MATPTQNPAANDRREFLRHTLATLAYRGGKVVRGVPAEFANFCPAEGCRTPLQILAHLGDLMDWAVSIATGNQRWQDAQPQGWDEEVKRFFAAMEALDACLVSPCPEVPHFEELLFQGPIADALTHVGQIAILRRLAGYPVKGENYFKAEIVAGRVGAEQAAPKREF
jgi:hypothetical protein